MRLVLAFLIATPAVADIDRALDDHILPGHAALVEATATLAEAAAADCRPEAVKPAYHAAYDAWIGISHIHFGPIEDQGLSLAMAFWPDPKNATGKALGRLTAAEDPVVDDPDAFNEVSVAAQGFTALERLLYDDQPDADYACRLTRAVAIGLVRKAEAINGAWADHAALMRGAGENTRYQSREEVERALYTALSGGLEFLHDQRLGRPMGTFERPRPTRAEAHRSQRSLRNITLSLTALEALARAMADNLPETTEAFAATQEAVVRVGDPTLALVSEPAGRLKVEVLQQAVAAIRVAVVNEIGQALGIQAGFNSMDGD